MTEPTMTLDQAQTKIGTLTFPKVTKGSIEEKIANTRYLFDGVLTICIIEMKNGFKATGKAAPASPENFDPEVGKRYAYEDAFRSLWPVEGYLLCELLHSAKLAQGGSL